MLGLECLVTDLSTGASYDAPVHHTKGSNFHTLPRLFNNSKHQNQIQYVIWINQGTTRSSFSPSPSF
jgi:hypothetical protein